jgi:hypothetical protein
MTDIIGYIAIGLFAFSGLVAVYCIIDMAIQLYKQDKQ